MDYYLVAETTEKGFTGQFTLEEIARKFHAGELPGNYVATKSLGLSYHQLLKSGSATWITVTDLVANLPAQNFKTESNMFSNTDVPRSAMPLDKNRIATWVGFAGGGVFFILDIATKGQVSGGFQGGIVGFTIGYALTWLVLALIPSRRK